MEQDTSSSSSSSRKRERDGEEEGLALESSSTSKRLCQRDDSSASSVVDQDLCSILEEAEHSLENGDLDETQQGLVSDVMRSLEEELGVSSSCSDSVAGDNNLDDATASPGQDSRPPPQVDIGYLLEASDDELGLEPSSAGGSSEPEQPAALVEAEDLVRGESWDQNNWSAACADFSNEDLLDGLSGQLDQQEWLRRTLELLIGSNTVSMGGSVLGQGFEPTTPVLEAGLIQ